MSVSTKLFATIFFLSISASVIAQPPYDRYGYGAYGYGGGYHSSTFEEGVQRGYADIVRSAGAYNLMTSEAAKNYEDARSQNLDNRLKYTQTYFDMRAVNRQARAQERGPRLSSEQLFRIAKNRAPETLSSSDLDPLTGDITWPVILEGPEYTEYRSRLEALFAERAHGSGLSSAQYLEIQQTTRDALNELKKHIRDYPSYDYLAAKKFLEGMAYSTNRG